MNSTRNESRFPIRTLTLAAILALAGSTAPIVVADDKPADTTQSKDDALKGPEVKDRDVPGGRSSFGGENADRRRDGRGGPMIMLRVLRSLGSEEAPDEVRASPEQADEIRGIVEEFRDEQKAFRDEHQDEIKTLREKAGLPAFEGRRGPGGPGGPGDAGGPGGPGGPDGAPQGEGQKGKGKPDRKQARAEATPEQLEARQQLKALMDKGPKFETYQTRIWEVLSPAQQTYVKGKMEEAKANMEMNGPGGPGGPEGQGFGPPPPGEDGAPRKGKGKGKAPGNRQRPAPQDDEMMPPPPPPSEE